MTVHLGLAMGVRCRMEESGGSDPVHRTTSRFVRECRQRRFASEASVPPDYPRDVSGRGVASRLPGCIVVCKNLWNNELRVRSCKSMRLRRVASCPDRGPLQVRSDEAGGIMLRNENACRGRLWAWLRRACPAQTNLPGVGIRRAGRSLHPLAISGDRSSVEGGASRLSPSSRVVSYPAPDRHGGRGPRRAMSPSARGGGRGAHQARASLQERRAAATVPPSSPACRG